jgi:Ni,Fe-hydrogenase III large subunit
VITVTKTPATAGTAAATAPTPLPRRQGGFRAPLAALPELPAAAFRAALVAALDVPPEDGGPRVLSFFGMAPDGSPAGGGQQGPNGTRVIAVLGFDRSGEVAALRGVLEDGELESLTPAHPQVHLFERELAEQFGVRLPGHPWLKPVRFPRLRADGAPGPLAGDMDFYRVDGEAIHEVAVGPVHAGVIEPGHFRFQCHGEEVLHLEISLGYQHRGVEALLAGGPHPGDAQRLEAVAGDTSIGHATAHALLVEALAETPAPPRARALRAVALELERIANHVGDVGAMAGDTGFLPTSSFCGRLRGDFLNLSAELCGSRFGRGMVRPGGVLFDVDEARLERILDKLAVLEPETRGAIDLCFDTPSVLARFEGTGVVSPDDAELLGLVGVAARACGLARDTRRQYLDADAPGRPEMPVVETTGDVFARGNVRRREIYASLALLRQVLRRLDTGPVRAGLAREEKSGAVRLAPESLAVGLCEGWRGEVAHAAVTDARGLLARYRIVDPSLHNWSGLALALRGQQISDFPLCNKSFNLSYCGFDL